MKRLFSNHTVGKALCGKTISEVWFDPVFQLLRLKTEDGNWVWIATDKEQGLKIETGPVLEISQRPGGKYF